MDTTEAAPAEHRVAELRREAYTMAFYVAICLLAALSALSQHNPATGTVLKLTWGTTIGLALAHWFAFRVSSHLVINREWGRYGAEVAAAQLLGALTVAGLATVPVVLFESSTELSAVRLVLAAFIGVVGFAAARANGANTTRSVIYGAATLVVAESVAVLKNILAGH